MEAAALVVQTFYRRRLAKRFVVNLRRRIALREDLVRAEAERAAAWAAEDRAEELAAEAIVKAKAKVEKERIRRALAARLGRGQARGRRAQVVALEEAGTQPVAVAPAFVIVPEAPQAPVRCDAYCKHLLAKNACSLPVCSVSLDAALAVIGCHCDKYMLPTGSWHAHVFRSWRACAMAAVCQHSSIKTTCGLASVRECHECWHITKRYTDPSTSLCMLASCWHKLPGQ